MLLINNNELHQCCPTVANGVTVRPVDENSNYYSPYIKWFSKTYFSVLKNAKISSIFLA